MKAHSFLSRCLIVAGLLTVPAFGLPPDRIVQYAIRVDPGNPSSRVQYVLSAALSAQVEDAGWVGWEVNSYTITEKGVLSGDTVWSVDFPFVDTSDGLWWVQHADPNNPIRPEFTEPAGIVGTARATNPAVPDLHFRVVGVPYAPPVGGAPYEVTGAVNFTFSTTAAPDDAPDDSGDGEPVDIPIPPQDPPASS